VSDGKWKMENGKWPMEGRISPPFAIYHLPFSIAMTVALQFEL
jgi:hypothetical protein